MFCGGLLQNEPVEKIVFPEAGIVSEQEKQQACEVHRGLLGALVLFLRICRSVVADSFIDLIAGHRGEQGRHQAGCLNGRFFLFFLGNRLVTGQEP